MCIFNSAIIAASCIKVLRECGARTRSKPHSPEDAVRKDAPDGPQSDDAEAAHNGVDDPEIVMLQEVAVALNSTCDDDNGQDC